MAHLACSAITGSATAVCSARAPNTAREACALPTLNTYNPVIPASQICGHGAIQDALGGR